MNLFNRLAMTCLAFLLSCAGAFVVAATSGWIGDAELKSAPLLRPLAMSLASLPGMTLFWTAGGGIASVLAGLVLLAAEVRPPRRPRDLVLCSGPDGSVRLSVAGLRRLAEHVTGQVPGVMGVVAEARPEGSGVGFRCRVDVAPEASIPEVTQQIRERLDAAVRHHSGHPVASLRLDVQTHLDTAENGRRRLR
ncbi:MAG: hypothetical protein ACK47B_29005 [Armatimonadota bacterium]